jgi:anti-anti-sigma factor
MAKKERLGSDPLSFIKDTRIEADANKVKPVTAETAKAEETVKNEIPNEEKPAIRKTDYKKETDPVNIIKAENLSMHIKKEASGLVSILFDGEMSIYNVKQIKNSLADSLNKNKGIELDLSKVNKIDTAGYQVIIAAKREAAEKGKTIKLLNPAGEVNKIFKLYGESLS